MFTTCLLEHPAVIRAYEFHAVSGGVEHNGRTLLGDKRASTQRQVAKAQKQTSELALARNTKSRSDVQADMRSCLHLHGHLRSRTQG